MEINAQVVYEQDERFDFQSGPYGYSRVGLRINDRVFWLGLFCGSGGPGYEDFKRQEELAKELERRINAPA